MVSHRERERNIYIYVCILYCIICTYSMEYPDEISRKIGEIPVDGDVPWYPDEYPVGEIPVVNDC